MGSVTEQVLHATKLPMLIVRPALINGQEPPERVQTVPETSTL